MLKLTASSFEPFRALMVLPVLYGIVFATACAKQSWSAPPSAPATQSTAAKIRLNGEDVGTTEDTSVLVKRFTEIIDHRTSKGGNFFIRAENGLRFSEVIRVAEALSQAHGIPDLAFDVEPASAGNISRDSVPIGRATLPRSLMLVVTVGNLGSARGELISGGLHLYLSEFTMRVSARHSVPKEFVVVEVFRDNEYVIGDKSVPAAALKSELQARLSRNEDKRVMILTRSDAEIQWGSFMEVAQAARAAGADMIHILTLTP